VLTSATSDATNTIITGTLNSIPNTEFTLEFFANTACDPSGFGEGEIFLGSTVTTTNSSGDVSFTVTFTPAIPGEQFITATATDPNGNTSEFSECVAPPSVVAGFSAFPTSGLAPLLVQFLDNSTGDIDTYLWSFGDGLTSTLPSPTHTYTSAGVYTVSLTVAGSGGSSDTLVKPNYITVTSPDVTVTVQDTDGMPEVGLPVYVFDDTTYTGFNGMTDAAGQVTFTLPEGSYRFRADKNGTQFWSGETNHCTVPGCVSAVVTTSVPLVVSVADTDGTLETGLNVYVFDGATYTGFNGMTDAAGQVTFTLPLGDYRFRADKNGTQFWSGETNHCTVPGCTSAVVTTTIPVVVTVEDSGGNPEVGLPVYVFDGATYTGFNATTDASGQVTFTLPLGDYRFRADKNGTQYWSGATNHCAVPGCTTAIVTIASPDVTVTVQDTAGMPETGLTVYVFDGSTYTGYNGTTGAAGQVTFTLPEGSYRFRADKNGTQFWSEENNHCPVPGCASAMVTTSVPLMVTVEDTGGSPEAGLNVYVFDGATYTGFNGMTDVAGQVTFTLPLGDYRFRADKNGTQFWSGETNHCTVPGCTSAVVTTTIPVVVTVEDSGGSPEVGLPVYVFDGTTYTGFNGTTDAAGQVNFTLPLGDYRFRADKNGTQFWSGETNHCTVPGCTSAAVTTTIPVVVTVENSGGNPETGLPVYVFDGSTYTGFNQTTDAAGQTMFTLPEGEYRFRMDKAGEQYWSGEVNHCPIPGCTEVTITL
jgi:PKD repeat protein